MPSHSVLGTLLPGSESELPRVCHGSSLLLLSLLLLDLPLLQAILLLQDGFPELDQAMSVVGQAVPLQLLQDGLMLHNSLMLHPQQPAVKAASATHHWHCRVGLRRLCPAPCPCVPAWGSWCPAPAAAVVSPRALGTGWATGAVLLMAEWT